MVARTRPAIGESTHSWRVIQAQTSSSNGSTPTPTNSMNFVEYFNKLLQPIWCKCKEKIKHKQCQTILPVYLLISSDSELGFWGAVLRDFPFCWVFWHFVQIHLVIASSCCACCPVKMILGPQVGEGNDLLLSLNRCGQVLERRCQLHFVCASSALTNIWAGFFAFKTNYF